MEKVKLSASLYCGKVSGGSTLGYLDSRALRVPSGYFGLTSQKRRTSFNIMELKFFLVTPILVGFFGYFFYVRVPYKFVQKCCAEEVKISTFIKS